MTRLSQMKTCSVHFSHSSESSRHSTGSGHRGRVRRGCSGAARGADFARGRRARGGGYRPRTPPSTLVLSVSEPPTLILSVSEAQSHTSNTRTPAHAASCLAAARGARGLLRSPGRPGRASAQAGPCRSLQWRPRARAPADTPGRRRGIRRFRPDRTHPATERPRRASRSGLARRKSPPRRRGHPVPCSQSVTA